jgi:choline-sulfatase
MSDQHRRDAMGSAGDATARTPNLDALAASGVRFDSAYCASPVCVPARASLLTGLYPHRHGAYNNTIAWPYEHRTVAHYLGRAGYLTALIGKMHFVDAQTHGFDYHLDFNDWFQLLGPKTRLYADELGQPNSGSGQPQIDDVQRESGDPWRDERERDGREGSVAVGRISHIPEDYQFESFVAREAVRFLNQHGNRQPFFLIASFLKPHDPFMPVERFARMFRPEDMRLPDTWGKVDLKTAPAEVRRAIERNGPTPELSSPEVARRRIALYYASLAQMDEALGKVMVALRDLDLERNTIVLYTSDHGEMLGDHGLWQKFQFYEGSGGVPLLMRTPGATQAGAVCHTPVSHVQVLPTLAELCGVPALAGLDGTSFVEQLRSPATTRPATIYSEYALGTRGAKYMIRRGDMKYTFRMHDQAELFDLHSDPQEMRNLALEESFQSRVAEMKDALFAWHRPTELDL